MKILKNFSVSETKMIANSCIIFLQDENGNDWYELQKDFSTETLKVAFDTQGVIVSMSYDVSALCPVGFSVAEVSATDVPDGADINGGWVFDGKKITPRVYTKAELIAQAEVKRDSLMAVANAAIAPLQDAVDIDEATDAEIALLKEWKKYRVALNRLNLSAAPDIDWPNMPA